MSDINDTTSAPVAAEAPTTVTTATTAAPEAPEEPKTAETTIPTISEPVPTADETNDNVAAVAADDKPAEASTEKTIEPLTEGQLSEKGSGLLKAFMWSKREFWLSDEPTSQADLTSYLRGEKPEIAHPVAAWAQQTGKGLLFFNKKGDTSKARPDSIVPLYDAAELRKVGHLEIVFKLHGAEHTYKAVSANERDAWFASLEKTAEVGRALKPEIEGGEAYKAKLEELNKPPVPVSGAVVALADKKADADKTDENQPPAVEAVDEDGKKKQEKKSRSTSRGVFERLRSKKDDLEQKKEQKKEEKAEDKEESKKDDEVAEGAAATAGAATIAAGVVAADENKKDDAEEPAAETKTEEKPKAVKRNSIFGIFKGQSKDKEVEPKADVKDGVVVAEEPPQVVEAAQAVETPEGAAAAQEAETKAEDSKTEEPTSEEPKEEVASPGKEKKSFLAGFSFKRNRSTSPSQAAKEAPAKDGVVVADEPPQVVEAANAVETPEGAAAADEAEARLAEPKTETTTTPVANKRQSIIGTIGRRASLAFKGKSAKKETPAPEPTAEEEKTAEPVVETTQAPASAQIGDVVPEAVHVGSPEQQPPVIAASA